VSKRLRRCRHVVVDDPIDVVPDDSSESDQCQILDDVSLQLVAVQPVATQCKSSLTIISISDTEESSDDSLHLQEPIGGAPDARPPVFGGSVQTVSKAQGKGNSRRSTLDHRHAEWARLVELNSHVLTENTLLGWRMDAFGWWCNSLVWMREIGAGLEGCPPAGSPAAHNQPVDRPPLTLFQ